VDVKYSSAFESRVKKYIPKFVDYVLSGYSPQYAASLCFFDWAYYKKHLMRDPRVAHAIQVHTERNKKRSHYVGQPF